ncbi:MAG: YggS family pyridoxal phosphate-dependent enzyme [Planctomycetota bacterium]
MLKNSEKEGVSKQLRQNLAKIKNRIRQAAERSNRNPDEIKLIAVTKTVEPPVIESLYSSGITEVGENRVQSAEQKIPLSPSGLIWHMIGHLQTNKVKKALRLFDTIHSLDNLLLAETINKYAGELNKRIKVFIQVNTSGEISKFGVNHLEAVNFYDRVAALPYLQIQGLMTMAPFTDNPDVIRPCFIKLRELLNRLQERIPADRSPEFKYLSMGMSQDFEIAVEEGAHVLRIGTALFKGIPAISASVPPPPRRGGADPSFGG